MSQKIEPSAAPLEAASREDDSILTPVGEADLGGHQEYRLAEAVGALHLNINRLREQLARPSDLTAWDAGVLEWQARELGARMSPDIRDRYELAIAALVREARLLAMQVRAAYEGTQAWR